MKKIAFIVLLFVIILIAFLAFIDYRKAFDEKKIVERNESFNLYRLIFKGNDGKDIYALFFKPLKKEFDVVIVLPAAAGTKESRRFYGGNLNEMGYGALILDQRGIGETDGYFPSFQEDFNSFLSKKEVYQILMAKDVISAINFLEDFRGVGDFAVLGESMGGRNAIIAAGLDGRIKTTIIISSAGYSRSFGTKEADEFLAFINPNSYIGRISPRRLLMLHAINDSVIPISDARYTFSSAGEPKRFFEFDEEECNHGYCEPMYGFIEQELREVFG